ncbi:PIG-L deacetylase family protein [Alicyclobacillus dauci]|uniref:PIG-L family deacetylase n=1 Tax=Alicyclobacillus dauci TaxID=1475485 RepID=A0ABY6Z677_9BACL|nr:PIG-L deacetylase family protein [Alicyclobacillus dauci]WAH38386.1 PIG-L family deacetylase [Alicyclobacillus dauci]
MNIRNVLGLPEVLDVKKVIAIQPHPDDNEVNIAGTLMELHNRGCEIVYVTVTDGRAGGWGTVQDPNQIVRVREQEKINAGKMIGVDKHIDLGFPDGGNYDIETLTKRLVEIYRQEKPDLVFTVDPWMPYEAHPDHVKVGRAASSALLFSNNPILYPIETHDVFQVPQIAFYATSYPNTWIDITANFERKMESIVAHKSQFDNETWSFVRLYFAEAASEAYLRISTETKGFAETLKVLAHMELHSVPTTLFS